MFGLTALELARIQFGFTMSSHIIFPAITIGLASYLVALEGLWLWKKDIVYRDLYHFWSHIFAVNFAMGVASGIVMAYQFGTNWSYYSAFAGSITGPLLSYEVLTAFFLEAGFLGVMLFGWNKVGSGLHFFATLMVALGTLQFDAECAQNPHAVSDTGQPIVRSFVAKQSLNIQQPVLGHQQPGAGAGKARENYNRGKLDALAGNPG